MNLLGYCHFRGICSLDFAALNDMTLFRDRNHSGVTISGVFVGDMAYRIRRKLENGELWELASMDDLSQAKQLLESFREHWPGDYSIQDSATGLDIELDE